MGLQLATGRVQVGTGRMVGHAYCMRGSCCCWRTAELIMKMGRGAEFRMKMLLQFWYMPGDTQDYFVRLIDERRGGDNIVAMTMYGSPGDLLLAILVPIVLRFGMSGHQAVYGTHGDRS